MTHTVSLQIPRLPKELERLIFVLAAQLHKEKYQDLLAVCYRVKQWVEEALFECLIYGGTDDSWPQSIQSSPRVHRCRLTSRVVGELKERPYVTRHVKGLFIGKGSWDEAIAQLLTQFPSLYYLHLELEEYVVAWAPDLAQTICSLPITRLSIHQKSRAVVEALRDIAPLLPGLLWTTLTHLHLPSLDLLGKYLLDFSELAYLATPFLWEDPDDPGDAYVFREAISTGSIQAWLPALVSRPSFQVWIITTAAKHNGPMLYLDALKARGIPTEKIVVLDKATPYYAAVEFQRYFQGDASQWEEALESSRRQDEEEDGLSGLRRLYSRNFLS